MLPQIFCSERARNHGTFLHARVRSRKYSATLASLREFLQCTRGLNVAGKFREQSRRAHLPENPGGFRQRQATLRSSLFARRPCANVLRPRGAIRSRLAPSRCKKCRRAPGRVHKFRAAPLCKFPAPTRGDKIWTCARQVQKMPTRAGRVSRGVGGHTVQKCLVPPS